MEIHGTQSSTFALAFASRQVVMISALQKPQIPGKVCHWYGKELLVHARSRHR